MNDITQRADWCQWGHCQLPSDLIYLGAGLCEKHWAKICELSREDAYKKLGIKSFTPCECNRRKA